MYNFSGMKPCIDYDEDIMSRVEIQIVRTERYHTTVESQEKSVRMKHTSRRRNIQRTALIQPSFSGLFVICAYFPNTTLPPAVTSPSSETLTSMTVPFVM